MKKNIVIRKKILTWTYVFMDFLAAALAWACFFSLRKFHECDFTLNDQLWHTIFCDYKFYLGIIIIPLCWIFFYTICGTYTKIWRKSRMRELSKTLQHTFIASIVLFFVIILDDYISNYTDYIRLFIALFVLSAGFTLLFRLSFLTYFIRKVNTGKIKLNVIFVGDYQSCKSLLAIMHKKNQTLGMNVLGYVDVSQIDINESVEDLQYLGQCEDLQNIITKLNVEEVIVAATKNKLAVLNKLIPQVISTKIMLKVTPDVEDHILLNVKDTAVLAVPFICIDLDFLPQWQKICKRIMDIICSSLVLILGSPLYLILAIGVKRSSPGKIFFRQERIGKNGKPFNIIKFRSMHENAEENGPQLSKQNDSRITKFGRFLRRTHLDEIPQFINVLKGDMTLVGPRPERQYYIDQIMQKAPYYKFLLCGKPGVTSWGQVCYGYAENVDQMIERLNYDLRYIENMSIMLDFKIIIYTILCMLKLSGK